MTEPNRRVRYGQLQAKDAAPYQLTGDDVLWTARAALYEGGSIPATLWTLTQRYAGAAHTHYPTFGRFVQAFSQPINPIYTRTGSRCRPGGVAYSTYWCTEDRLAKRDEARNATWADLIKRDPAGVETIIAWANGELPNPVPRAVNFADRATVAKNFPDARVVLDHGNLYITAPWSEGWTRSHVSVVGADGALANADGTQSGSPMREALAVAWDAVVYPWRVRART
jgi:hypothetical protein